jgi:mono/diheme cytochrome c family protein
LAQAAFAALANRSESVASQLVLDALRQVVEQPDHIPAELHLDILEAARGQLHRADRSASATDRIYHSMQTLYDRYTSEVLSAPSEPSAAYKTTWYGGDVARGQNIFFNNIQVQCLRCHQIGNQGGNVGPKLDGIGSLRSRAYLVESIVAPNTTFSENYIPPDGGLSAMPEGLADLLTRMELRDLVAYLASLK